MLFDLIMLSNVRTGSRLHLPSITLECKWVLLLLITNQHNIVVSCVDLLLSSTGS